MKKHKAKKINWEIPEGELIFVAQQSNLPKGGFLVCFNDTLSDEDEEYMRDGILADTTRDRAKDLANRLNDAIAAWHAANARSLKKHNQPIATDWRISTQQKNPPQLCLNAKVLEIENEQENDAVLLTCDRKGQIVVIRG